MLPTSDNIGSTSSFTTSISRWLKSPTAWLPLVVLKADSTFKSMSVKFPDHYLGYLSSARTNSALDPETTEGLAKPYYEKALEVMLPSQNERKAEILECYRYLGYYYYVKNELVQSKTFWNKVLEIDPTDAVSLQVIKSIDSNLKKGK
mgnify:CR=1 FL=1